MAAFKVSESTSKLLKNFAGISNSVLLREGSEQRTMAVGKSVLAVAELPEAWPVETGIFDLNSFLGVLSLFKAPAIDFQEGVMAVASGSSRIRYRISDPSTIQVPPSKNLKTTNPGVTFTFSEDALSQLNKTCAMLKLASVSLTVAAGAVTVRAADAKNPNSHAYEYVVPEKDATFHDASFERVIAFKQEHLAMLLDGSYDVSLSDWSYGHLKHQAEPVSYFIVGQV